MGTQARPLLVTQEGLHRSTAFYQQRDFIMTLKKLHNPKSHSPAIYIPCWLSQVPNKLISHGAKLVYGRLSQWCNSVGKVYRSAPQLAIELGMCVSSVEKYQKELRRCELIGTFQTQAGGVNHFEFYDHPWMYEEIHKNLTYEISPPYDHTVPPVQSYGTPPYKHADINKKEIKTNKKDLKTCVHTPAKNDSLTLSDLQQENPFSIPPQMLEDWITNRKKIKVPITKTAWSRVNCELAKLVRYNVAPLDAFEEMVSSGWRSLKAEWFGERQHQHDAKQQKDKPRMTALDVLRA